ncbi:hypothetical protein ACQ4PT_025377 [Festuca glaucescens]
MASGSDPGVGEASVGPETRRVHDWVPEGMELRFAFLVNIRRDRYIVDAKNKKKFHGGFDYPLPMDCNWSFRQFGEVICRPYPWGLHDEVEFKYYDGGMAALEALDITVLQLVYGDVVARRGSTSVGTCRRVPIEVEPDSYNSGDDEERLYSDVVRNLRRTSQAKNQDEADNDVHLVDDEVGEEEDLAAVEWDRENPQMEEGSIFASMSECRNALVAYYIKAEHPAFGESFDENVDTNEDPNEEENVDPNEEENDDHNEEAPNDDPNEDDPDDDHNEEAPNDDPNEAPIDGGQPSVVASSARFCP